MKQLYITFKKLSGGRREVAGLTPFKVNISLTQKKIPIISVPDVLVVSNFSRKNCICFEILLKIYKLCDPFAIAKEWLLTLSKGLNWSVA